jgi:3-oxoacyl-[acyl-carrier-protein] synthase II
MRRQTVITGYGVVSGLGMNKYENRDNIFAGKCGIANTMLRYRDRNVVSSCGAIAFDVAEDPFFKEHGIIPDRVMTMAVTAANECVAQADIKELNPLRVGVVVGTLIGAMRTADKFHSIWLTKGLEYANVESLKQYPLHAVADVLARKYGFNGIRIVVSTACASGANALGIAQDFINDGMCDVVIAGGVDPLSRFTFAGFSALGAISRTPCQPYSVSSGINVGEGAAFFALESDEHAKSRNAPIIAEFRGYGLSADAYHATAPDPNGHGALRSMKIALQNSECGVEDITYINGHGTATPSNDTAEKISWKLFVGEHVSIPIISNKAAIGHCMGAAGAMEIAVSLMSIEENKIPPTANVKGAVKAEMNIVPNKAIDAEVNVVLSNSFAFGGNNCSAVVSKYTPRDIPQHPEDDVVFTGIGCAGVGGRNIEELFNVFRTGAQCFEKLDVDGKDFTTPYVGKSPFMDDKFFKNYIPAGKLRRLDKITKLAMTSGKQALMDSKLKITPQNAARIGVIYGTSTGPISTVRTINEQIIKTGISGVSPDLFTNSVFNATAGQFSIANNIKGPTSTVSVGGLSGAVAVIYATMLLKNNQADVIIIISADEWDESLQVGNERLGLLSKNGALPFDRDTTGMILSEGSVALVMERKEFAFARNARIYARMMGYFLNSDNAELSGFEKGGNQWEEGFKSALAMAGFPEIDYYALSSYGIKELEERELDIVQKITNDKTLMRAPARYIGTPSGSFSTYSALSAIYALQNNEPPHCGDLSNASERYKKLTERDNGGKQIKCVAMSSGTFGGTYSGVILGVV